MTNGPAFTKILSTPRTQSGDVDQNIRLVAALDGEWGDLEIDIEPRNRDLRVRSLHAYLESYVETTLSAPDSVRAIVEDLHRRLGGAGVRVRFTTSGQPPVTYAADLPKRTTIGS